MLLILLKVHFITAKNLIMLNLKVAQSLNIFIRMHFQIFSIFRINLPQNLNKIGEVCFSHCQNLSNVTFEENSSLQIIRRKAFSNYIIQRMIIPSHVKIIDYYSFYECKNLQSFLFENNSELVSIGKQALSYAMIGEFSIPSHVKFIHEECFRHIFTLTKIKVSNDSSDSMHKSDESSDQYNKLIYSRKDIKKIIIPESIKEISRYAFENCNELKYLEFFKGIKLNFIHKDIFKDANIESLVIPSCLSNFRNYLTNPDHNILRVGILDDEVNIDSQTYSGFKNLKTVSVPYASIVTVEKGCDKFDLITKCNDFTINEEDAVKNEHKCIQAPPELLEIDRFPTTEDVNNFVMRMIFEIRRNSNRP